MSVVFSCVSLIALIRSRDPNFVVYCTTTIKLSVSISVRIYNVCRYNHMYFIVKTSELRGLTAVSGEFSEWCFQNSHNKGIGNVSLC